jgi:hypothetical protein
MILFSLSPSMEWPILNKKCQIPNKFKIYGYD